MKHEGPTIELPSFESEGPLHTKQSHVERASAFARRAIVEGDLKPGESISDVRIAAKLGISRTPVREALRRLELEGLILHEPHRGWAVRRLKVSDVAEIFEIKESLETMLVRQATPNLTADARASLKQSVAEMERAAKGENRERFMLADDSFHDTLYEAASNARAKQILSSVNAQWRWLRVALVSLLGSMPQAVEEHRAVLECALTGDPDGVAVATARMISRVKNYLISVLSNVAVPFAATIDRR